MKTIGGYFELELADCGNSYHDAATFKSGRSALHYILQYLKPQKVFIPFYTCDALLQPFLFSQVTYQFYQIDQNLDPLELPELQKDEYFLYINYFDIKRDTVAKLCEKYEERLIVDCSQAFFMKSNGRSWFFNSCRKYFGVPDGAYLMPPVGISVSEERSYNENYTVQHLIKRLEGNIEEGFDHFKKNEMMCDSEIKKMSKVSEAILSHVNFPNVIEKRVNNYKSLHQILGKYNRLNLSTNDIGVPMAYPLLLDKIADHKTLWKKKVFVPVLWPDVSKRQSNIFSTELQLTQNLLPLPVDQRYSIDDMQYLANLVKSQC